MLSQEREGKRKARWSKNTDFREDLVKKGSVSKATEVHHGMDKRSKPEGEASKTEGKKD